jgi:hypothetical protein
MGDRSDPREGQLRQLYAAFNARNVDAVLGALHHNVDWPNVLDGGHLRGHDDVRAYWARQFAEIDPRVEPVGFVWRSGDRVAVDVHQIVRTPDGELVSDVHVTHVYTFWEGLVERMEIEADTA